MKKYLLLLLLIMATWVPANAQITIPETVLTSKIGTAQDVTSYDYVVSTDMQTIVDASGANQMWDFSGFVISDTFMVIEEFLPASMDIPGSDQPHLSGADFVIRIALDTLESYVHHTLQNGEFRTLGITIVGGDADMDGMEDIFSILNDPPSLNEVFPIEFGDVWSDSSATAIMIDTTLFVTLIETKDVVVDGWGTLITSEGSAEALRYVITSRTVNPLTQQVTNETFVDFVTAEGAAATISIDGNGQIFGSLFSFFGDMVGTDNEVSGNDLPGKFQLSQNFPNPFNPSTVISYALPETSDVRLTVYTITGQEVATLVNGTRAAGSYDVAFDATDLASGVYLYRLETNGFSETRLMNLIK